MRFIILFTAITIVIGCTTSTPVTLPQNTEKREEVPMGGDKVDYSDIIEKTKHLHRDALLMRKCSDRTGIFFGGKPPKVADFTWPTRDGRVLTFLACVDCAGFPASEDLAWLPRTGCLLFFYDTKEEPWGFDPKDRGGCKVIHLDAGRVDLSTTMDPPGNLAEALLPKKVCMGFTLRQLPPDPQSREMDAADLSIDEGDAFYEYRTSLYENHPRHQVGGYPYAVQSADMDVECQLVTNGLYCGDPSGYNDPRAAKLKPGAKDWSLLLQMDSDDDLGVMWGDCGTLYFWVRREEAKQLNFDNAWVILQCY